MIFSQRKSSLPAISACREEVTAVPDLISEAVPSLGGPRDVCSKARSRGLDDRRDDGPVTNRCRRPRDWIARRRSAGFAG
jgi:hypothetical protein